MLNSYAMTFDGSLLERGFWLYVWDIRQNDDRYLYVGRTGDSSSANAASPFNRIGQHLDFRANAKATRSVNNSAGEIYNLPNAHSKCSRLDQSFPNRTHSTCTNPYAIPLVRSKLLWLTNLVKRGYNVIGIHGRRIRQDADLWADVLLHIDTKFPSRNVAK